jgi:hypothetical protein
MALQSPLVYGRILACQIRQIVPRLLQQEERACRNGANVRRYTRLVTAYCGFSKDLASSNKRFAFGEDAFFVTEDRATNVLGIFLNA